MSSIREFEHLLNIPSPLQKIEDQIFVQKGIEVYVKRDDLIHETVSGNKWRKLKYNIERLFIEKKKGVITFGGAFSNHIHATAAAGKLFGFETVGIIRGEELDDESSETLKFASSAGMKLLFVSRSDFRNLKNIINIDELSCLLGKNASLEDKIIVPEGGTNDNALKGGSELVSEIIEQLDRNPNYLITAVGSGGTLAGIASNFQKETMPIGVCVLKNGNYIFEEIESILIKNGIYDFQFEKVLDAHCGGYAKTTPELIQFINEFEKKHGFLLDQVYTGKVFFDFYKKVKNNFFKPNATVVILHTGGLQGRNNTLFQNI